MRKLFEIVMVRHLAALLDREHVKPSHNAASGRQNDDNISADNVSGGFSLMLPHYVSPKVTDL